MLFIYYYIFFQGEDISNNNEHFWDEFFLLKPKVCVYIYLPFMISTIYIYYILGIIY